MVSKVIQLQFVPTFIFYDINMQNFKRKVKLPNELGHKKEQPLTAENIKDIFAQHCNNRRLKCIYW